MRIGFEAPAGFTLTNSPQSVGIAGPDDVRGEFSGGRLPPGGLESYARGLIGQLLGEGQGSAQIGVAQSVKTNGLPALLVPVLVSTDRGDVRLDLAVYDAGGGAAYHFILVGPASRPASSANALFRSFHHLTTEETTALRSRHIKVAQVRSNDTLSSLAQRMAGDQKEPLFLMLNGLEQDARLSPGRNVKLIERD
jgi:predicted Zn-dependent protease